MNASLCGLCFIKLSHVVPSMIHMISQTIDIMYIYTCATRSLSRTSMYTHDVHVHV